MKQAKISGLQLFYVILGFMLGTTMILGLGAKAKQDAWLVILISMLCGLILMGIFTQLSAYYPEDTLVEMIPKIIGKYLSFPLIIMYILYFIYSAARACRDFGELIVSTILVGTPTVVVIGGFMVLMIYCLRGGVETFGRMGEVVFPTYIFSLVAVWILLMGIEQFELKNLTPVLGNGIKPIVKEVFPGGLNFPFGETVIILMFFPFLNKMQNVRKVGMSIIFVGGILLAVNLIMILSVLGAEIFTKDFFPLLSAARMVSIADFLERFDALIILMMVTGVFFKVGGWTFGAAVAISQVFKLKQTRSLFLALGIIITPLSLIIGSNFVEHLEIGFEYFIPYFLLPLQTIIPILLLCIAFIRKKFNL
ncbi:GerAB/ArcD/ProY family transporter [Metabacillus arenae]|uniref:GerAB/ArcD/ProY family transporter n=1 Tax=Metabacillus arenae TaxID=2771434 RepID=A0A926NRC9_9BACI|nr:GerAB/ArcD/ProY family transporter [Metabacillus arenae]MBD1382506.1 GerAB/ArcD/ProY family transporter [Metabacillus arenae]